MAALNRRAGEGDGDALKRKRPKLKLKQDPGIAPIEWKPESTPPPVVVAATTSRLAESGREAAVADAAYEEDISPAPALQPLTQPTDLPLFSVLPILAIVVCWAIGFYRAIQPEPSAASRITSIATLANARTVIVEPDLVYFSLSVDPAHQDRWVRILNLKPVPFNRPVEVPQFGALSSWQQQTQFVRPPFAAIEIEEWWRLRKRSVTYGFSHEWSNGAVVLLDLESNLLVGWASPDQLSTKFN